MKRQNTKQNEVNPTKSRHKTKKFKAQPKKEKQVKLVQPKLPKSANEISSNWLALKQVSQMFFLFFFSRLSITFIASISSIYFLGFVQGKR